MSALKIFLRSEAIKYSPRVWLAWHELRRPKSSERELHFLDRIVAKGDVCVDVGANVGLYTRRLARLCARVHAFEPGPEMARLLRRTVARNVTVHELGLSDTKGEGILFTPKRRGQEVFGLAALDVHQVSPESFSQNRVALDRLDNVITEPVRFIKIDVEGHELQVLNGATKLISAFSPVFLIEAENRHRPSAVSLVFDFFRLYGYRSCFLRGDQFVEGEKFDPEVDQDANHIGAGTAGPQGKYYINNFFFFQNLDDMRRLAGGSSDED